VSNVVMVTGGARSGKSRYALKRANRYSHPVFVATAVAVDAEMAERIASHRVSRNAKFTTIEEPVDLAGALRRLPEDTDVVIVDCLTVWLGNLFHRNANDVESRIEALLDAIRSVSCDMLIVTNELGMGIVPDNAAAREFRDAAGRLNQRVASAADEAVLLVSGIPQVIKENSR
jgi:adenosylcobinamide kinase/adenosylcobinamide-phosphate guanylyltransferase